LFCEIRGRLIIDGFCRSAIAPDLAVALWLAESLRPISEIEDPGLVRLFDTVLNICCARLHFELPSADTVARRLEALANDLRKKVLPFSLQQLMTVCSACFNHENAIGNSIHVRWMDKHSHQGLFGRDCSLAGRKFRNAARCFARSAYEGAYRRGLSLFSNTTFISFLQAIKKALEDTFAAYGITDIAFHATTDNGSNMVSAISQMTDILHTRCFAHTLQLLVNDALKINEALLTKVKDFVAIFRRSPKAADKLRTLSAALSLSLSELKSFEPTRWQATFYMIDSLVRLWPALKLLQEDGKGAKQDTVVPVEKRLTQSEVDLLERIAITLHPYAAITEQVGVYYSDCCGC
jgi:hypothetical protein